MLTCPAGHQATTVAPWDSSGDGYQWYECLNCGYRGKVYVESPENMVCPNGCVCGRPASDHPSEVERMSPGPIVFPANAFRDPNRIDPAAPEAERHPIIEAPASHPEHAHSAASDPCAYPAGMRKLVGFLCVECGLPIEGLPTKSYE